MKKKKKLWSSSGNLAQKTVASIKSVIGKEISSHDVCRILKEEQASVFLGICYAPKMPLFKAQSGKSATPFKIAFYNDWEKRQRPKSMPCLWWVPHQSGDLIHIFKCQSNWTGGKGCSVNPGIISYMWKKNAQYFAQELLIPALSIKVFVRWRSSLFPIYIDGKIFWSNLSWISNNLHKKFGVIFST